jgi:SAM-dependent MidA family methyltransferase
MVNSEPNSPNVVKILNPMESVAKDMYKDSLQNGDRIEISPKSMIMMNSFAEMVAKVGGGILAVDYGDAFGYSDSLRVECNHPGHCKSQVYSERGYPRVSRRGRLECLCQFYCSGTS